jgi:hypothetical protein
MPNELIILFLRQFVNKLLYFRLSGIDGLNRYDVVLKVCHFFAG